MSRSGERVETVPDMLGGDPVRYIRLKSGRRLSFWEAVADAERAHTDLNRALARAFRLARSDWEVERVEDRVARLEDYLAVLRAHLAKLAEERAQCEKIEALRNVEGRSPEEAAAYLAKADELERKMG